MTTKKRAGTMSKTTGKRSPRKRLLVANQSQPPTDLTPQASGHVADTNGNGVHKTREDIEFQQKEHDFVFNLFTTRRNWERQLLDDRRSINAECGYPDEITLEKYRDLYDRESIATKSVEVLPKKSWALPPTITEDEDPDTETAFELAWEGLGKQLSGETRIDSATGEPTREGWLKTENTHPIWSYLLRADILSGIGHYSVILLGFDDINDSDKGMEQPVQSGEGRKLLFIRVFDEVLAPIGAFEVDPTNPRFGQPSHYNINFNDPKNTSASATASATSGVVLTTKKVHWSRVIHIADNLDTNEVFGVPRMQSIYNRLYDLRKMYGGSAEMYWRGAFPGISLESHPQLGPDASFDTGNVKEMMDLYSNGLQRYITLEGASANSLAPQVVDPTPQIDVQITAICIILSIPKRVFMGSERGELASGEDHEEFNTVLQERQTNYLSPRIIAPVVDRLIMVGVLPEPEEGYTVEWPDLNTVSDLDKSIIAKSRAETFATYLQGGVESLIPPMEFLTEEMGYTEEKAEAVLESAMQRIEDEERIEDLTAPEPEPVEAGAMDLLKQKQTGDQSIERIRAGARKTVSNEELQDVINEFNLSPSEAAEVLALHDEEVEDEGK